MTSIEGPSAREDVAKPYDQFILFGDSITQMSYNQEIGFGYGAQLQEGMWMFLCWPSLIDLTQSDWFLLVYARKLDVVNRGFSYVASDRNTIDDI